MSKSSQKQKSDTKSVMAEINKIFGEGSVMMSGDTIDIETISSGSINLDHAVGVGGFPKGRIVEIYGEESTGKTTLALHHMAEVQKKGGLVALVDTEHAFDKQYARKIGIDTDKMIFSQPDYLEKAAEIVKKLSTICDCVVFDSVIGVGPKAELEGTMEDTAVGKHAYKMGQFLRTCISESTKRGCTLVFINQLRDNVGIMYGPNKITGGGNALKFYASMRLEVKRRNSDIIKSGDTNIGQILTVTVRKNKLAAPFEVTQIPLIFGEGISRSWEIVMLAEDLKIIKKKGPWYSMDGETLAQGQSNLADLISDNPELEELLVNKINSITKSNNNEQEEEE